MTNDSFGDHFSVCMPTGRVKARASPVETTVAQICREAGGHVRTNVMLRDLNTAVAATDEKQLEVVVSGLSAYGGQQLAIDVIARSVLRRDGLPRSCTDWRDGTTADGARASKEAKYPELARSGRCKPVVLAVELGGRFSSETVEFLRQLSEAKAQTVPSYLRASAARAYERRWTRMLAIGVAPAHTAFLLLDKDSLVQADHGLGTEPWLQNLLTEARGADGT